MTAYLLCIRFVHIVRAGIACGVTLLITDGLLNANSMARQAYSLYRPILRDSVDVVAGSIIDLSYGFLLAGLLYVLWPAMPGQTPVVKGLAFGVMLWLLRTLMPTVSHAVVFALPHGATVYSLVAGLFQALLAGIVSGVTL